MSMAQPGDLDVATADLATPQEDQQEKAIQGRSLRQIAWRRLKHDKVAMAGGVGIIIVALVAIFASLLNNLLGNQPGERNTNLTSPDTTMPYGRLSGASSEHWLGVQPVDGQDILARLIAGARTSLMISVSAMAVSLLIGLTVGVIAGYYRGKIDAVVARVLDVLLAFPTLLFAIALMAIFGRAPSFLGMSGQTLNFAVLIFVLGFFGFAYLARIVRGQVLSLREKEFVDAARSLGASDWRIITREILPNLMGPVLVWVTLTIPSYILGEAGLSYLGVGVQPPTASWGQTLNSAGIFFQNDPMFLVWPGMALFLTVLSFNLFGDGLRDALDPKSTR
ncbi:MAG TPA: ABC transporter permease [Jatrophihabitans sp.]|jgi:ABC-type dipeptide/oligopeptide/nickel transport system permease subunit|uniref:ABC transporter permease n=1 Tax=Jatrophihabitans sp. TaxID=1932789 RepID=UPI002EEBC552